MIAPGRRSKTDVMAFSIRAGSTVSLPNVSTNSPTGAALPIAYAIGKAAPVGLFVETFGSETVDPARIEKAITSVFDLRPGAIIRDLDLLRPIYAQTAAYGHFGRTDIELPWEQTNKVEELKESV